MSKIPTGSTTELWCVVDRSTKPAATSHIQFVFLKSLGRRDKSPKSSVHSHIRIPPRPITANRPLLAFGSRKPVMTLLIPSSTQIRLWRRARRRATFVVERGVGGGATLWRKRFKLAPFWAFNQPSVIHGGCYKVPKNKLASSPVAGRRAALRYPAE